VLVSTIASKSILRAVADELCRRDPGVAYFPSYEIVTGPQTAGRFYAEDLREVTPEGVAFVMSVFRRHYLAGAPAAAPPPASPAAPAPAATVTTEEAERYRALTAILCDEEAIVAPGEAS
jgi:hypothetical protein